MTTTTYSDADRRVWATLFHGYRARLLAHGCKEVSTGFDRLGITERIDVLDDLDDRLWAMSGWRVMPVDGLLPARAFFELLARRVYPMVARMRRPDELDFAELPDAFHDVAGHLPLLLYPGYARFLETYTALVMAHIDVPPVVNALARLYWYTIETGLVLEDGREKIFGAAILTSRSECDNARSPATRKLPLELDVVLATPFNNLEVQPWYFVLSSFDAMLTIAESLGARVGALR